MRTSANVIRFPVEKCRRHADGMECEQSPATRAAAIQQEAITPVVASMMLFVLVAMLGFMYLNLPHIVMRTWL